MGQGKDSNLMSAWLARCIDIAFALQEYCDTYGIDGMMHSSCLCSLSALLAVGNLSIHLTMITL